MKKITMTIMIIITVSCSSVKEEVSVKQVRQADLDSWIGIDLMELETHPLFSIIPLKKTQLHDGSVMYF